MAKRLRCVFERTILPWERDCFEGILASLSERYVVHVEDLAEGHRRYFSKDKAREDIWWLVSRSWKDLLYYLGVKRRNNPQTFISVMNIPQERQILATLFLREWISRVPENCHLVLHSPINHRFYEEIYRIPKEQCHYVPLAVPAKGMDQGSVQKKPAKLYVATMGPFVGETHLNYFLLVAHYVRRSRTDIRFVIYGKGGLYPHFCRVATELGISDVVDIVETQGTYPIQSDVLLYTPIRNNSFTPLLAVARNPSAVVAADIPGIENFVEDSKSGFLVPAEDVRSAGELIFRLADNEELRKSLAEEYSKRVNERFGVDKLLPDYERILNTQQLAKSHSHRAA